MVDPRASKKRIERTQFDLLRELCSDLPAGEPIESDAPDFLLARPDGSHLGIELTTIFHEAPDGQAPRQASESLRDRVRNRAWEEWLASGGPPVHVSIHFASHEPLSKPRVQSVASEVCRAVREAIEADDGAVLKARDVCPEIASLNIGRIPGVERTFFGVPNAAFIPTLSASQVREIIDGKNRKFQAYLDRCSSAWLVAVFGYMELSTNFDLDADIETTSFSTRFERVYLLEILRRRLTRLTPARRGAEADA